MVRRTVSRMAKTISAAVMIVVMLFLFSPCTALMPSSGTDGLDGWTSSGALFSFVAYADSGNKGSSSSGSGSYMDINASNFFNPEASGNDNGTSIGVQAASSSPLWNGITNIIRTVITGIVLPIGIIMSTWRTMYLAIFCFIAGVDPLNSLKSPRYTKGGDENSARNFGSSNALGQVLDNPYGSKMQEREANFNAMIAARRSGRMQAIEAWNNQVKKALLIELKHLFLGLFITFAVWIIIQIGIWLAVIVLQVVGGFGS